jgi:hypothetical protein
MKKSGMLIVMSFVLSFAFTSCGGGTTGNSPTKAVEKSYEYVIKKDYNKVAKMYAGEDGEQLTEDDIAKLKAILPMAAKEFEKEGGIASVEVLSESISDLEKSKKYGYQHEHAKVQINRIFGNGEKEEDTIYLVKKDGNWFILAKGPRINF